MGRLIIVGAGAAGLMAAIHAGRAGCETLVLERNEKAGKKIYITGKGRCNCTHDCGVEDFLREVPQNPRFLYSALRFFGPRDLMNLLEQAGCPVTVQRGQRVFPSSEKASDVTRTLLKDWVSRYGAGDFFNWAIARKETGEVIGNISVVSLTEQIGAAEIGYCMGRRFWGQGIMPEALLAVEDYLFETVGLLRICAGHDVNNPKSGRVMDKAGMTREGVLRQSGKNNQGIVDVEIHSILRGEWEERRKGGSRESR